jgi:hypothetical protein
MGVKQLGEEGREESGVFGKMVGWITGQQLSGVKESKYFGKR